MGGRQKLIKFAFFRTGRGPEKLRHQKNVVWPIKLVQFNLLTPFQPYSLPFSFLSGPLKSLDSKVSIPSLNVSER